MPNCVSMKQADIEQTSSIQPQMKSLNISICFSICLCGRLRTCPVEFLFVLVFLFILFVVFSDCSFNCSFSLPNYPVVSCTALKATSYLAINTPMVDGMISSNLTTYYTECNRQCGWTPLMRASWMGQYSIVLRLLDKNVNIDRADKVSPSCRVDD